MTITELAIKRPSLVIVIFSTLALLGIFSYTQLSYELLPKITPPMVTITTIYPGASPQEIENNVSKPVEDAVSGMDKVSSIRSTSQEGVSFVMIELLQTADVDLSLQDAQRKIGEIVSKLPTGAKTPTVSKIALDEIPILRMGITSKMPAKQFYTFVNDKIKPEISKLEGVGQVNLIGGDEREIKINLDMQKLKSYGLSILQVTQAIKSSNLDFPTGNIKDNDGQFVVRVAGKFGSIEELRSLAIAQSNQGSEIKLADIAEVEDGTKDYSTISRINNFNTIGMNIQKQSDANAVSVAKLVRSQISSLEQEYSSIGLKFTIAQDGSIFTIDAANAVKEDLIIAVILVAIVMLMFLHSIRNSIIVMIAIPSSLISTFIAMYALGYTLNLMTLLGLSLVVGILVDDSIVVLENIYHHLERGEDKRKAALKGRNEIGFAALAITLVDVAVFLPLTMVSGIIGNILREFSAVVVVSTLLSLFVSFTITPVLASRFAKLERLKDTNVLGKFAIWFENKFKQLTEYYIKVLQWSFKNWKKVSIATIAAFFAAVALIPMGFIGSEFMTVADRGEFTVTLELPPGAKLENTNHASAQVERLISRMPEVSKTFVNVGVSSEGLLGFASNNFSEINVTLVPRDQREKSTDDVSNEIKAMVEHIPGIKVRVNPIGIFGVANQTPIQISIKGPEVEKVNIAAKQLLEKLETVPGTADVRLSSEDGKPETKVVIDRDKMNRLGLNLSDVGSTLRVALTGDDDSKFREGANEYNIMIALDQFDRASTDQLSGLTFFNKKGQPIELSQFATVSRSTGPTKLTREDRNSSVTLYSQVIGRPSGSVSQDFEKAIQNVKLPDGVTWAYMGDVKNQKESFSSLMLALMAAFIFTYLIMVALYDSFVYPFVVLFSVPLAMIGALLALGLTMKSLSIFSILGIIMLIGLVGKNAILLVDRTNYMRAEGLSIKDALIDAGRMRIRPIFMTTLTMIFGMAPIALSTSEGAEWKSGLAWALIGGLTSSLLLTLVVVPIVYTKVEALRVRIPEWYRSLVKGKVKELDGVATEID